MEGCLRKREKTHAGECAQSWKNTPVIAHYIYMYIVKYMPKKVTFEAYQSRTGTIKICHQVKIS